MLHAFFGSTVASNKTQVGITGFDITLASASPALAARAVSDDALLVGAAGSARSFDQSLREFERRFLAPKMGAARATARGGALRSSVVAVPNVGDIIQLNTKTGCTSPVYHDARVAAVASRAIVVADVGNPAGGFTDAEYQSIATTFDTLVDPLDRAAFGDPTDIDANSRIIIFYTRAVNERNTAGNDEVIEGFFISRDLFPRTGTDPCPGSNLAEMFYMIVPDPQGTINTNVQTKANVQTATISVIAHEYQHLINASRRLYVNDADDFEEVWLNEGLSHIAEELLFYRASGLAPRGNLTGTTVTASQRRVDAFNQHMTANFSRYRIFLEGPETSSPYADNDSLGNRGAIWSFLRYAADRAATSDGTTWQKLVNSKTTGIANLTATFGADVMAWIRDWSISMYTDDLVSTTSVSQQPSWSFRTVFPRLGASTFPLHVIRLADRVQTSQTLAAGGSLYTTFAVPAGVTGGAGWAVSAPNVAISIVRTK